ncbi:MAG: aldo/keto reductase [Marinosulfonomonas sp.]
MLYGSKLSSGAKLSRIGLGSWLTYGSHVDELESEKCINSALEMGVNVFDSAPNYGGGAAERILGKVLNCEDRAAFAVITKIAVVGGEESYKEIRNAIDASRRRLKTDYIDFLKVHHFDYSVDNVRVLESLNRLKSEGIIHRVGVCNWALSQMQAHRYEIDCIQNQYNLLWRYPERDVFAFAKSNEILRFSWSSLAQGMLTGKYHRDCTSPMVSRADDPATVRYLQPWMSEEFQKPIKDIIGISKKYSVEMVRLALSWIIQTDKVDCALIGARTATQVIACCEAIDDALPLDIVHEIDRATNFK